MKTSTPKNLVPIKLDFAKVDEVPSTLIRQPVNPSLALAAKFERSMFTYMRNMRIATLYTWHDFVCNGSDARWEWHFDYMRPEGHECSCYDFHKLLDLSDEEFDRLPSNGNKDVVRAWREAML